MVAAAIVGVNHFRRETEHLLTLLAVWDWQLGGAIGLVRSLTAAHTGFANRLVQGPAKRVGVGCQAGAHTALAGSGEHGEGVLVEEDGEATAGHIVDGLVVAIGDDRESSGVLHQQPRMVHDTRVTPTDQKLRDDVNDVAHMHFLTL